MKKTTSLLFLIAVSLLLAACGGSSTPAAPQYSNTATPEGAIPPTAPATAVELHFAIVSELPADSPELTAVTDAMARTQEARPKGLDIFFDVTPDVGAADAEAVLRELADADEHAIIWVVGEYGDLISTLHTDYRKILWAYTGDDYEALGDNAFWVATPCYEAAYLAGVAAGSTTASNAIAVTLDDQIAADMYLAGAQSVNPEAATGDEADVLFTDQADLVSAAETAGSWALGYGIPAAAGQTVVTWDPVINYLINNWNSSGDFSPLSAPLEQVTYGLAEGGCDFVAGDTLPAEAVEAVDTARAGIVDGSIVMPLES